MMNKRQYITYIIVLVVLIFMFCSCIEADNVKYNGGTSSEIVELKPIGFGLIGRSFQKQDGWIYYVDYATSELCRVDQNGEGKIQILDDPTTCFAVIDDRVFYITGYRLTSIGLDGSDKKDLFGFYGIKVSVRKMDVSDEWIYVLTSGSALYKISKDSSEVYPLSKHVVDFCINDGKIYYLTPTQDEKNSGNELWRMDKDGTNIQQLLQESSYYIDYDKNGIYYINKNNQGIYTVPVYGTEGSKIIEIGKGGLIFKSIGDWIYYEDLGVKPGIYKVKKDGTERTFITESNAIFFTIWDSWLLCFDYNSDSIQAIKVGETDTDELVRGIISEWTNVEIYD